MLLTFVCVFAFTLVSTSLFAQTRVPVGPPGSAYSRPLAVPVGPLPQIEAPIGINVPIGQSYDGIDFNGSNCGCLPPDTNAAVGNNFVMETVNVQVRVFDRTTGSVLLDEPLQTFFGAPSGGDPYVLYDDIANRWYVSAFDSDDSGLFIAVSNDGSPLDGFATYDLRDIGGFPDYAKPGFNKDAIFIGYNDFGSNGGFARIISIDKAAILGGTPTHFISTPKDQFRGMPPAQMHGDTTGGTEWFASTDGSDSGGTTMRVTMMTNYLSNSAAFTYTSVPVHQYVGASAANQPGGSITVFPNTTTYQAHYRSGKLVTAMASALSKDGFVFPKGLFYVFDVSGGTPTLSREVDIDPGTGVAVQMPSVDMDSKGNIGMNWIESSTTEFLSMWVNALGPRKTKRTLRNATDVTPNAGFMSANFRIGDYSTTVVDPNDGLTFWGANEYVGPNGGSDIWSTHIASFIAPSKGKK